MFQLLWTVNEDNRNKIWFNRVKKNLKKTHKHKTLRQINIIDIKNTSNAQPLQTIAAAMTIVIHLAQLTSLQASSFP